mmetsp:Transcript_84306/g.149003  ORF Transcript_84306/g.149003 Transcript_84306/m.149003 type:complete len:232 (+) Transcript_84306:74-769(+)|eukprot:CAMPEP_0197662654 /NCGR_PEP_ID=MMETSP1338-20131121/54228_1 /TAXON_ID=43686 ORGANISM="Pelagodinium beii, Strain RCC1491" /NCGR_SAMPLE_ID=MMETSP1338 /ASSEMBLY_ACC=CAM_ASM_000754 /LENGTH=231 /DNA_ID=CAMNT_0043240589 /DNA_START=71 /DNA_END=766 /DNA_ORIENTATION=+
MDSREAQKQIEQMKDFILAEAKDKATDIQKKGEEEFSIEVYRLINEQKEKVRATYERKTKQVETQYAIAKSMAINKQRLEKIKARQEVMHRVSDDAKLQLVKELQRPDVSKKFVTQLLLQGMLMLLENEVTVRCRQVDVGLVSSCLRDASDHYTKLIKSETGATKACTLSIDTASFLPPAPVAGKDGPSCLGGVVLFCAGGKISVDNTIDMRLNLVMEQAKPAIRGLLFPQ